MRRKLCPAGKLEDDTARWPVLDMLAECCRCDGQRQCRGREICPPSVYLMPACHCCARYCRRHRAQDLATQERRKAAFHRRYLCPDESRTSARLTWVVGHSERRGLNAGKRADVARKAEAAWARPDRHHFGIGESEARPQRRYNIGYHGQAASRAPARCCTGDNTVVAYEPIWAIGHWQNPGRLIRSSKVHDFHPRPTCQSFGSNVKRRSAAAVWGSVKPGQRGRISSKVENSGRCPDRGREP